MMSAVEKGQKGSRIGQGGQRSMLEAGADLLAIRIVTKFDNIS
ncbi:MAG: hypothetical protein ACR2QH_17880 [Geminicoccaceae bacterium]